jgi:predicted adenine nucleotide alpha hydrolase (AANH) superfamily ATPase
MTKLNVKRWTLLKNGKDIFSSNIHDEMIFYMQKYGGGIYAIRDNHAVIEKLAEKAKNN